MSSVPAPFLSDPAGEAVSPRALLALTQERRRRPLWLVAVAAGLLVLALVFMAWGYFARASAARELRALSAQADEIVLLDHEITQLQQSLKGPGRADLLEPLADTRTRIEQAWKDVFLPGTPALPRMTSAPVRGGELVRQNFSYDVHDRSLEGLGRWIEASLAAVPGLEVSSLTLQPQPGEWRIQVVFSRLERSGGGGANGENGP